VPPPVPRAGCAAGPPVSSDAAATARAAARAAPRGLAPSGRASRRDSATSAVAPAAHPICRRTRRRPHQQLEQGAGPGQLLHGRLPRPQALPGERAASLSKRCPPLAGGPRPRNLASSIAAAGSAGGRGAGRARSPGALPSTATI
jgi:hypothetical protein